MFGLVPWTSKRNSSTGTTALPLANSGTRAIEFVARLSENYSCLG
jgi:hypothetical protein